MAWRDLIGIYEEAAADHATEAAEPPTACPNDGQPLEEGPHGVLHCNFDGYTWPEGATGAHG